MTAAPHDIQPEMELLPCRYCGNPPGRRVGPPAMARCVADGCRGKQLGAELLGDWNLTNCTPPRPEPSAPCPTPAWGAKVAQPAEVTQPAIWCPGCSRHVTEVCHHFQCAIGQNSMASRIQPPAAQSDAVARLLTWHGPAHWPIPHGGVAARTYAEFSKEEADKPNSYWKNSTPLYATPPASPARDEEKNGTTASTESSAATTGDQRAENAAASLRTSPYSTENIEQFANLIADARLAYLDALHITDSNAAAGLRKRLEELLWCDKGTFAPALLELVDRRRAATKVSDHQSATSEPQEAVVPLSSQGATREAVIEELRSALKGTRPEIVRQRDRCNSDEEVTPYQNLLTKIDAALDGSSTGTREV
jgi:hypothetical protein